jgi:hypothetical protein
MFFQKCKKYNEKTLIWGIWEGLSPRSIIKVWGMTEVIPKKDLLIKFANKMTVSERVRKKKKMYWIFKQTVELYSVINWSGRTNIWILTRIYIGWDSCRVYQHIDILRCFRCNQFGHMAIKCEGAVCCTDCAENHESKDCDSGVKKCEYAKKTFKIYVNSNHPAYSMKCHAYLNKLEHKLKYDQWH